MATNITAVKHKVYSPDCTAEPLPSADLACIFNPASPDMTGDAQQASRGSGCRLGFPWSMRLVYRVCRFCIRFFFLEKTLIMVLKNDDIRVHTFCMYYRVPHVLSHFYRFRLSTVFLVLLVCTVPHSHTFLYGCVIQAFRRR